MEYQQRLVVKLMKEMEHLNYWDKDIWQQCFDSIGRKKRINNIYYLSYFNEVMKRANSDPSNPFFEKLDDNIKHLKEKHYNVNRQWRYDFDNGRFYTLDELIAKRENSKQDDLMFTKGGIDQHLLNQAIQAEKKMKRLRMAKYS